MKTRWGWWPLAGALLGLGLLFLVWFHQDRHRIATLLLFALPPLLLSVGVLRRSRARFWAGVMALGWFSHAVMSVWSQPGTRHWAWLELILALLIVGMVSTLGLAARLRRKEGLAAAPGADGPYHVHAAPPTTQPTTQDAAMEELLIVTTGGTIDKIYFDDKSDYQVGDPQIGNILKELGVTFRFNVITIMRKDSLHITEEDRALIHAAIAAQPARRVLITHGTDSMVRTGMALKSIADKTIVLTGALNPARFHGSDAEFNIGCAVGAVQSLPAGVYIAMNGRIWDPEHVRKNAAANRFEAA